MKYPEVAELAKAAFEGSGCASRAEFVELYGCSARTLSGWMVGERAPDGMHRVVLKQAAKGWRPA